MDHHYKYLNLGVDLQLRQHEDLQKIKDYIHNTTGMFQLYITTELIL